MDKHPDKSPPSDRSVEDDDTPRDESDAASVDSSDSEKDNGILAGYRQQITLENFKQFFEKGCSLKNDNNFNEALLLFKALQEKGAELYGSATDINLAMVYFQLGNSMLEKVEESTELFHAEHNLKIAGAENRSENSEEMEPMEPVWENLEVARMIIKNHLDSASNISEIDRNMWTSRLANTHIRLGECLVWKEDFVEGIYEFGTALELLNSIKSSIHPRRIASAHYQKATAHLTLMNDESLDLALFHFQEGKNVLTEYLEKSKDANAGASEKIQEIENIVSNFDQKIEDVKLELATKEQVIEERKKIKELMSHNPTETTFAQSKFENTGKEVKMLGRFGKSAPEPKNPNAPQTSTTENRPSILNITHGTNGTNGTNGCTKMETESLAKNPDSAAPEKEDRMSLAELKRLQEERSKGNNSQ